MSEIYQIHLNKKGMSRRAVRYAVLPTSKVEAAEKAAALEVTKDSTMAEFGSKAERFGMEMMIHSISEPASDVDLPKAKWHVMTPDHLALKWGDYFGVKDTSLLRALYRQEHSVTQAEADEILSGKVAVIED